MAIVEMKKLTLLALKRDREKLMRQLQKLGCVQIVEGTGGDEALAPLAAQADPREAQLAADVARMDAAIVRLTPLAREKRGIFEPRPAADAQLMENIRKNQEQILGWVAQVDEVEQERLGIRAQIARAKAQKAQLWPWRAMDEPLDQIRDTRHAVLALVSMPPRAWGAFAEGLAALDPAPSVQLCEKTSEAQNALVAVHRTDGQALEALLRDCGGTRLSFDIPLTAKEKIAQLDRYIEKEAPQQMAKLEARLEEIARHIREIQILRDLFALERDRLEAASRLLETREAFWLTAWTPARDVEAVREALCKVTRDVEMEFSDPAEDEEPPVQLRNGSAVAPFESIVGMYSLPAYRGFDPTAVMMPFFLCFFGMMMSDAGYGIIMAITCFFAYSKLKKQNRGGMLWILALGGVATAIWGYLLGGFFSIDGAPQPLGFTFTSDPLKSLILCAILGAVHLFVGLGVAAYMNIRRGKIWAAIFDQVFWIVLLSGLGVMFLNVRVGAYIAIPSAVGIFFTAGRERKNVVSKLVGGFSALYGATSYVSDVLSYARLFGMGLATGMIGMAFNTLAGMVAGSWFGTIFAVLILAVGHTFNLGINALGAYVHSCRLQYIEFFGKFYEDGGKPFQPLRNQTKYVDLANDGF